MVCTPLTAPQNGGLDSTDVSYGSVVTVSCTPGFKFPDGVLSKQVQCIAVGSPQPEAVWNANVDDCQRLYHARFVALYTVKMSVYPRRNDEARAHITITTLLSFIPILKPTFSTNCSHYRLFFLPQD